MAAECGVRRTWAANSLWTQQSGTGAAGHLAQQHRVVRRHPRDGGRVEEVNGVREPCRQMLIGFGTGQREVELYGVVGNGQVRYLQARPANRRCGVLQGKCRLEKRVVAQPSLRGKFRDQPLDWDVLLGVRIES